MKKYNVFLFVHWQADCSDVPSVRWITVLAKERADIRTPSKWHGYFVSKATIHPCGG